jgi:hypothetical protein
MNGGSLFWKSFVQAVADNVANNTNTRVLNDIKELYKTTDYDNVRLCTLCNLPTDAKRCEECLKCYCNRDYACKHEIITFSCCDECDDCHKCSICDKINEIKCSCKDDVHFYCEDHKNTMEKCTNKKKKIKLL